MVRNIVFLKCSLLFGKTPRFQIFKISTFLFLRVFQKKRRITNLIIFFGDFILYYKHPHLQPRREQNKTFFLQLRAINFEKSFIRGVVLRIYFIFALDITRVLQIREINSRVVLSFVLALFSNKVREVVAGGGAETISFFPSPTGVFVSLSFGGKLRNWEISQFHLPLRSIYVCFYKL